MKKKGLLLVVALLALSGLMAAMAYSKANVTSTGTITIASTNSAILAFIPGEGVGLKDNTAYLGKYNEGTIGTTKDAKVLKFRPGYNNGQNYGLQPESLYQWFHLFTIKNNSDDDIEVKAVIDSSLQQDHVTWGLWIDQTDGAGNAIWLTGKYIRIPAGKELKVSLSVTTYGATKEATFNGNITFDAVAVP